MWSSKLGPTSTISSSNAGLLLSRATASWHRWQVVTAAGARSQQQQLSLSDGNADVCRHSGQSHQLIRQWHDDKELLCTNKACFATLCKCSAKTGRQQKQVYKDCT